MNIHFYESAILIFILIFCAARLPAFLQYRRQFKKRDTHSHATTYPNATVQTTAKSPGLDAWLVLINGLCWTLLPGLWALGFINTGQLAFSEGARIAGIVFALTGVLLMGLANYYLRSNWSAIAEIRQDHELITNGLYRYVRHPMYTAFFCIVIGLLLLTANAVVGGLALIFWLLLYSYRIDKEEALLLGEFGKQYVAYIGRTGRLLPRVLIS